MNDQPHDRRASAACGDRLPFGGKMNDEDEITDLRRKTVHGNGAAPHLIFWPWTICGRGTHLARRPDRAPRIRLVVCFMAPVIPRWFCVGGVAQDDCAV